MDGPSPPQFSLRSAFIAIALIASELGLIRWCGQDFLVIAVAITALPFCVAMELVFPASRPRQPRMSLAWYFGAHILLVVVGGLLGALALLFVYFSGVPQAGTPLPLCAVLAHLYEFGIGVDVSIPLLAFVAATLYLGRTPNPAPIRLRFPFLLGIGSALTLQIGARAVEVDAWDDAACQFYMKYGFIALADNPRHLYLAMETIRQLK
jgi:hypothetical protein